MICAQPRGSGPLKLRTGKEIYQAACVACHGPDGKGQPDTTVGFEKPETFPDFTACDATTRELDVDWRAIIRDGGAGRGFSRIMPSFSEALTPEQINLVIGHLRGFCRDASWPRGELNLPRPLATEKAFPEDEAVITTAINARGAPGVSHEILYERRVSARNQIELALPVGFTHDSGRWLGGVGDIGLGIKRTLVASDRTGSIFSVQGEAVLPTGDKAKGLGSGVTVWEAFGLYGQLLPAQSFVQLQAGTEMPTHTRTAARALFWRAALGKSFRQDKVHRLWSPMLELVADREFQTGSKTNWDILPQFQVTINRRQHIRANLGVRIPATNTTGRPVQVVFYILWDWFDGGLLQGWK